jgi:hypothetical protein
VNFRDSAQQAKDKQVFTRSMKTRYLLGLAALATGAALLVYFLTGISLWVGLLVTVTGAITAVGFAWRLLSPEQRLIVRIQACVGVGAGLLATVGYDLSRFILVRVAHFSLWPFDTFRLFGQLLIGTALPTNVALLIGTCYHVANGIGFALAYVFLFGRRGWLAGILWAMGLEVLMVSFYPGWLGLKALDEFLTISVLGHVVYGTILGVCSQRLLARYIPGVVANESST